MLFCRVVEQRISWRKYAMAEESRDMYQNRPGCSYRAILSIVNEANGSPR